MKVVIFANGDFSPNSHTKMALKQAGLVIAADNGARHCFNHGIMPDVVIGDFDSLCPKMLQELQTAETEIIRHPTDKSETDLELALEHALSRGATHVTLLGILGGRWDMSLSNIFLLSHPKYHQWITAIINHDHLFHIITPYSPLALAGEVGDTLSLIPLTPIVTGVNAENLLYPLSNEIFYATSTRGVSNELLQNHSKITIETGVLLCVYPLKLTT